MATVNLPMRTNPGILILAVSVIAFPFYSIAGDLSYKVSGESGATRSAVSAYAAANYLLFRLDGLLKYSGATGTNSWAIEGRLRPELFVGETNPTALSLNFKGNYLQRYSRFHWAVDYLIEKQIVDYGVVNVNFDFFRLGGQGFWFYRSGSMISFNLGYAYRDLNSRLEQSLDAAFGALDWFPVYSLSRKVAIGAYFENFRISRLRGFTGTGRQPHNRGWRFGPQFSLGYRKKIIISANYRFLLHQSDLTRAGSYEHWVRLMFGKLLSAKWSLFFLLDYFFRDYSPVISSDTELLYAPLDNQNHLYLKLEREITPQTDLFFRVGYLNENLIYRDLTFSGWRVTVGMEWSR
jgi:hypothetical protein